MGNPMRNCSYMQCASNRSMKICKSLPDSTSTHGISYSVRYTDRKIYSWDFLLRTLHRQKNVLMGFLTPYVTHTEKLTHGISYSIRDTD